MTTKLELRHLAPYLPFGLKIFYHGTKRKINAGNGSSTNWIGITATLQRQGENCKPILRNLSDLTKEIEVNGKKFVPAVELKLFIQCDIDWWKDYGDLKYGQYDMVEKLFEWHFDVFSLIDKGLAIDINTLNP